VIVAGDGEFIYITAHDPCMVYESPVMGWPGVEVALHIVEHAQHAALSARQCGTLLQSAKEEKPTLRNVTRLKDFEIRARDGKFGTLDQILFR
jgi:hypothetical protein